MRTPSRSDPFRGGKKQKNISQTDPLAMAVFFFSIPSFFYSWRAAEG